MKLPNGYGSIVNLGKKRRKPFAVRISVGTKKNDHGGFSIVYKYLDYFATRKEALIFLADYNVGKPVKEHENLTDTPTFKEIYDRWLKQKLSMNKKPSPATVRNYGIAFRRFQNIHDKKFINIRVADLQDVADQIKEKSNSTVTMAKTVVSQMYEYAIRNEIVEKNYAKQCVWQYTDSDEDAHVPFTDDEILFLWKHRDWEYVDMVLMMIYTGFRASEFLSLEIQDVHLDEQYVVGGMKSEAGRDRVVPIHNCVMPFFRKHYNPKRKYLFTNTRGNAMDYTNFLTNYWKVLMDRLDMKHTPHDTRHTFATLADRFALNEYCLKLIIGHSITDLTKGVYTHKLPSELLAEMNKIQPPALCVK